MTSFNEIEQRSSDLLCPACGTCSISVHLRCDGSDRTCIVAGACARCGRQYDAEVLPTHQERFEALQRTADAEPCPVCAGRRRTVRSLCDRTAKECFFLLACRACGDVRLTDE